MSDNEVEPDTPNRGPTPLKWNLRKSFVKEELDIATMQGEDYSTWQRQFKNFLEEGGFHQDGISDTRRLSALEQCVNKASYKRITAIQSQMPAQNRNDIQLILAELNKLLSHTPNIWASRKEFRLRTRKPEEKFKDFSLEINELAEKCQFGSDFCDDCQFKANNAFILHQLVFEVNDAEIQMDFLKKDDLTIDDANKIATNYEILRSAQSDLQKESNDDLPSIANVEIGNANAVQKSRQYQRPNYQQNKRQFTPRIICNNCLIEGHRVRDPSCPALHAECKKCGNVGHWARACRQERSTNHHGNSGFRNYQQQQGAFQRTGAVVCATSTTTRKTSIKITANGKAKSISGMIDTGSDWVAMGRNEMIKLKLCNRDLKKPTEEMLRTTTANGHELKCLGYINAKFEWENKSVEEKIVFFRDFPNCLWSLKLLETLNIITINPKVGTLESDNPSLDSILLQDEDYVSQNFGIICDVVCDYNEGDMFKLNDIDKGNHDNPQVASVKQQDNDESPNDNFLKIMGLPTRADLLREYSDVFSPRDEPMDAPPMVITLTPDAVPTCVTASRGIPRAYLPHIKKGLEELEANDIIEKVTKPTTWCAPMVAIPSNKGSDIEDELQLRLAVDYRGINRFIRRETFQTSTPLEVAQDIEAEEAIVYSIADAWKSFHQQGLAEESMDLTTFIAPFDLGRYRYKRAPFGISNISDIFNRNMTENLRDLPNTGKVVDDNIIYSKNPTEHANHVRQFLDRCRERKIRLNAKKFKYMQNEVVFAGMHISRAGYRIADSILNAIKNFPVPENKTDLRSFQGLANQLAPTNQELTKVLTPLRPLLKKDVDFVFDENHLQAFNKAKEILASPSVMAFYQPGMPLRIHTDASCIHGLGFCLQQKQKDGQWRPILVGSRSLTDAERNYAPIELELMGIVFATNKCRNFLYGIKHFEIYTDQKPLVSILNKRRLDEISNQRMLNMILRLMDFNFTVQWVKGAENLIADSLSRHPVSKPSAEDIKMSSQNSIHSRRVAALNFKSADMSFRMMRLKEHCENDLQYQSLKRIIKTGFPENKNDLDEQLRQFWNIRYELCISEDDFILFGHRLLIPTVLRKEILTHLHKGHRGINGTQERARLSVYWPNIDAQIQQFCQNCEKCFQSLPSQPKETAMHFKQPSRAWEYASADLFTIKGQKGLVYTDWYSGWFCYAYPLNVTDASKIIPEMRKWFRDTQVPDIFQSDQGPPFSSVEFQDFLKRWGVAYQCSSAEYPQGNSFAELAVKNIKSLLEKYYKGPQTDWESFDMGLLQVRNTPHKNGLSPAILMTGKPLQDTVPAHKSLFTRDWHSKVLEFDQNFANRRDKMEQLYNRGARDLPPLRVGDPIAIQNKRTKKWDRYGVVQEVFPEIRRYLIRLASGMMITRNRRVIRKRFCDSNSVLPPIKSLIPLLGQDKVNSHVQIPSSPGRENNNVTHNSPIRYLPNSPNVNLPGTPIRSLPNSPNVVSPPSLGRPIRYRRKTDFYRPG